MMVYNNSFPGPLLEANWGDQVVVHVTNNLQNNGYLHILRCVSANLERPFTGMELYKEIMGPTMEFQGSRNVRPSTPKLI
jgi:FtsP/CotA-like multicopper oxidase with cupredoxin domain